MNKAKIKELLEAYPRIYLGLLSLKRIGHWSRSWIVRADTEITIEGFPRSGNSFAKAAFRFAEEKGREHRMATHVHSHAQIIRSAQLGVPTMVLVRAPKDTCLSLVALSYQIQDKEVSQELLNRAKVDLMNNLASYHRFYKNVLRVADGIIIADFNLVTTDYGEVIRRVNCRYGTDFPIYEGNEANEEKVFESGGFHLSPDAKRDGIKDALRKCYELDELQPSIANAQSVYEDILKLEREQAERYAKKSQ